MRILFYTILVSVGLCLSIVILVPSFFDLNSYKTRLYKLVESQTGYNLEIKGPIRVSVFPKLISRLPKPGAWMETLKEAMAFPIYATVAWLLWTLNSLI